MTNPGLPIPNGPFPPLDLRMRFPNVRIQLARGEVGFLAFDGARLMEKYLADPVEYSPADAEGNPEVGAFDFGVGVLMQLNLDGLCPSPETIHMEGLRIRELDVGKLIVTNQRFIFIGLLAAGRWRFRDMICLGADDSLVTFWTQRAGLKCILLASDSDAAQVAACFDWFSDTESHRGQQQGEPSNRGAIRGVL